MTKYWLTADSCTGYKMLDEMSKILASFQAWKCWLAVIIKDFYNGQ